MMAWPRIVFAPSTPSSCIQAIGRLAVAGDHLVELDHRLGGVDLVRAAPPRRRSAWPRAAARACRCRSGPARRSSAPGRRGRRRTARGTATARRSPCLPGRLVPLPLDAPAVAGEPAARSGSLAHVDAHAVVAGPLDHVLAEAADLHDGGDAAPQQLGHREVDAGAARLLVLGPRSARAASRRAPSTRTGGCRGPR